MAAPLHFEFERRGWEIANPHRRGGLWGGAASEAPPLVTRRRGKSRLRRGPAGVASRRGCGGGALNRGAVALSGVFRLGGGR